MVFSASNLLIRILLRIVSQLFYGKGGSLTALSSLSEEGPRSLSACDSLLLPKIRKDFPDFDEQAIKDAAVQALTDKWGTKPGFQVYNVVISGYHANSVRKTVVLQAALSWREAGQTKQMRSELHATYRLTESSDTTAINCPNCGGALTYGETECSFCGTRVVGAMSNWNFSKIRLM